MSVCPLSSRSLKLMYIYPMYTLYNIHCDLIYTQNLHEVLFPEVWRHKWTFPDNAILQETVRVLPPSKGISKVRLSEF